MLLYSSRELYAVKVVKPAGVVARLPYPKCFLNRLVAST